MERPTNPTNSVPVVAPQGPSNKSPTSIALATAIRSNKDFVGDPVLPNRETPPSTVKQSRGQGRKVLAQRLSKEVRRQEGIHLGRALQRDRRGVRVIPRSPPGRRISREEHLSRGQAWGPRRPRRRGPVPRKERRGRKCAKTQSSAQKSASARNAHAGCGQKKRGEAGGPRSGGIGHIPISDFLQEGAPEFAEDSCRRSTSDQVHIIGVTTGDDQVKAQRVKELGGDPTVRTERNQSIGWKEQPVGSQSSPRPVGIHSRGRGSLGFHAKSMPGS